MAICEIGILIMIFYLFITSLWMDLL